MVEPPTTSRALIFDVVSMAVDINRVDYGKFVFTMTLTVFDVHFRWSFLEDRAPEKEENKLRHYQVISKVY